jgi:hypothetical protein
MVRGIPSFAALMIGVALPALLCSAQDKDAAAEKIRVSLVQPLGMNEGKLEIRVPKQRLFDEVTKGIPESVDLPDERLGNQLIYRDVELNKVKATGLKPSSLSFKEGKLYVEGAPSVKGELNCLYEHVVIKSEVRTIGVILGREIKQAVPVVHRDWRPKGPAPLTIKVEIRGTCEPSFPDAESLDKQRIQIKTQADFVKITSVDITTDDGLVRLITGVVAAVGKAFPNEGFNKPIKDALTRQIDIDPWKDLPDDQKMSLQGLKVKDAKLTSTETEVIVSAVLIKR